MSFKNSKTVNPGNLFPLIILLAMCSCMHSTPPFYIMDYYVEDDYPINSVSSASDLEYQQLMAEATKGGWPGFTFLIDGPDGFWAGGGGRVDIASRIDMRKNQMFKIGSVTKVFTAALILDLEEDGLLSIDEKAEKYLPDEMVRKVSNLDEATIEQLLNHKSGIPNFFGYNIAAMNYNLEYYNHFPNFNKSKEELIEFVYGYPAPFAPGDNWVYSNTNYVLLAMIAERITGKSYAQLLKERIFIPLELDHTGVEREGFVQGLARGYDAFYGDSRFYDTSRDNMGIGGTGDGGIISNTYDIAKFFHALFNLELFSSEQLNKMITQYPYNSWQEKGQAMTSGYTLGMFYEARDGQAQYYSHQGYVFGYGSDAYYFPDKDTVIVMLTNMTGSEKADEKRAPFFDIIDRFAYK